MAREMMRRVEEEVLSAMPERFVFLYERLWLMAVGSAIGRGRGRADPVEIAPARRVVRISTGQTETRGGARSGGVSAVSRDPIDNEGALEKKRRIDRKLRAIAREMAVWLGGEERSGLRRCSVCKRFGDDSWLYCPNDGKPMEEVDG